MKVVSLREIDGCQIVTTISECSVDPEATKIEIAKQAKCPVNAVYRLSNYRELFKKHKICFPPGPNQRVMEDSDADELLWVHAALGPNQLLSANGEIIHNHVGVEYWKKGLYVIEQTGDTVRINIPQGFKAHEW
jgi:hypothetical protein